jgi:hypothetical protein
MKVMGTHLISTTPHNHLLVLHNTYIILYYRDISVGVNMSHQWLLWCYLISPVNNVMQQPMTHFICCLRGKSNYSSWLLSHDISTNPLSSKQFHVTKVYKYPILPSNNNKPQCNTTHNKHNMHSFMFSFFLLYIIHFS